MRMIAQLLPFLVWPLHQKREGSSCWRCSDRKCCLLLGRTSAAEEAVCGPSLSWPEQVHARNTFHPPWHDLRCPSCANTLNRKQVSRFSNAKIARKKTKQFFFLELLSRTSSLFGLTPRMSSLSESLTGSWGCASFVPVTLIFLAWKSSGIRLGKMFPLKNAINLVCWTKQKRTKNLHSISGMNKART